MEKILRLPYKLSIALLVYMPFHIFLSQWLSTYTGHLDLWKIGKDLVLAAAILFCLGVVYMKRGFQDRLFWAFAGLSALYFALHLLIWQANGGVADKPALLSTAYNCRLMGFAILGWTAGILGKKYLSLKQIFQIAVIISTLICLLGILQMVLPQDFLSHYGYSEARGTKPYFFIDNKPELRRIMSTLREPNSLGAYLILPITVLAAAWLKRPKGRMFFSGLLLLHGLALFLTFSRSAWLGTFLSLAFITFWFYKEKALAFAKKYWAFLLVGLAVIVLGAFLLRNQYFVQNTLFHSDENTSAGEDSNLKHFDYLVDSTKSVLARPFGHGPGTAGPVSTHTDNIIITEDYFVQIAYEIGIPGLLLLIGLFVFVCRLLYQRNDFYARVLLASFVGITFCNFLLHTWTNEVVAAQWWILAGLVIGLGRRNPARTPAA